MTTALSGLFSIAPWQVHLCCMRVDQEACKTAADSLYEDLQKAGVEVIYDDRDIRAGAMFADADLLGVPVRVVVGPKNLKKRPAGISNQRQRDFQAHRLRKCSGGNPGSYPGTL